MDILSNGFTSISISLGNDIVNKIVSSSLILSLTLSLLLTLILVLILYSYKNNYICLLRRIDLVVFPNLVWSATTRMVLNLYPLHRGCLCGCLGGLLL